MMCSRKTFPAKMAERPNTGFQVSNNTLYGRRPAWSAAWPEKRAGAHAAEAVFRNPEDPFMAICCGYGLILTGEFDTGMGIMHSCIDLTPSLIPKHYHLPLFLVALHGAQYEKALNEAALFNIHRSG